MQKEWQAEWVAAGGVAEGLAVTNYGDPRAELAAAATGTIWAALTHIGIIRVTGADAATFLQGQLSNDVLALGDTSRLAAYCTAQGRMIALFRVLRQGDDFLLLLPAEIQAAVQKRLTLYVLRAKVGIGEVTELGVLGVSGPGRTDALTAAGLPAPTDPAIGQADDVTVVAIPGVNPRALLLGPPARLRQIAPQLTGAVRVGSDAWAWLDIQAGLPTIGPATTEAFVPQMANLDLLQGIHFRKGCYPGQEIVARTHYLGRLKQRMYLASLPAGADRPVPGDSLTAPNFPGQAAGTIVDAQRGPDGGIDLLAVIQISSREQGAVFWKDIPLVFRDLPYPLAANC